MGEAVTPPTPAAVLSVQVIRVENGYAVLVTLPTPRTWVYRQLSEALDQAERLLEPPAVVTPLRPAGEPAA